VSGNTPPNIQGISWKERSEDSKDITTESKFGAMTKTELKSNWP